METSEVAGRIASTERKQMDGVLRESEERYHALFKNMRNGYAFCKILVDKENKPVDFIYIDVNDAFETLTGLRKEDVIGKKVTEAIPSIKALNPEIITTYGEVALTGKPTAFEVFFKPLDIWLIISVYSPRKDHFVAVFDNITERKLAEETLKKSEERLKEAQMLGRIGSWEFDIEKQAITWSEETYILYERDPKLGPPSPEEEARYYSPEQAKVLRDYTVRAMKTGQKFSYDLEVMLSSGKIAYYHAVMQPVKDPRGRVVKLAGTIQDITERRQAEEELRKREATLQKVFDLLPVGLWFADKDGVLLRGNPAGVKIWGGEPKVRPPEYGVFKARRLPSGEDIAPDDWALAHTVKEGITVENELLEIDAFDGQKRIILNYTAPVLDDKGEVQGAIVVNQDITERKQAEEKLKEGEALYRTILETTGTATFITEADGTIAFANAEFTRLTGYPKEELDNRKNWAEFVHKDDLDMVRRNHSARKRDPRTALRQYEYRIVTRDGSVRDMLVTADLIPGTLRVVASLLDITERNREEEALRASEAKYRILTETIQEGIWTIDKEGNTTYVNPRMAQMLGYTTEEMLGKHLFSFMQESQVPIAIAHMERRAQGIKELHDFEFLRKDGSTIVALLETGPLTDEKGNNIGALAGITDITERKQAELDLQVKDSAIASSINAIALSDLAGNLTFVNPSFIKMWGYDDNKEVLGKPVFEFWEATETVAEVVEALKTKGVWQGELIGKKKDGLVFDAQLSANIVADRKGKPICMMASFTDITERKRMEQALYMDEERHRTILQTAMDGYMTVDFQGHMLEVNETYCRMSGYSKQELLVMSIPDLEATETAIDTASHMRNIAEKGEARFESRHRRKDGSLYDVEISVQYRPTEGGRYICFLQDITERKRAEESLRENEIIFSSFLEHSPVYVFFKDENIRALKLSKNFETMIGKPLVELLGKNMNELFPSELAQAMIAVDRSILAKGEVVKVIEEMNGRTYETTKFPIFKDNRPMMLAGFTVDITERKQAEEQVKASLKEKETLLKEIHHRVKNNMQVISSLLQLQSNFVKDKEDARLFQASQERIKSMSLVYNKLYQSKNLAEVSLKEYMTELVENLMRSYNTGTNVTTRMDIDAIVLGLDLVIPCGLIVNEIVTNSLKYAFRDGRTGLISISAHKSGADALEMKIADNGVGLPENVNVNSSQTLGMMLIYTLAQEQLDGTIEINRSNGTEYTIIFRAYPSKEANHEGD